MIIVCPKCSTRYMIPDSSIGEDGRMVRCNNCGETWHQELSNDDEIDANLDELMDIDFDQDDAESEAEIESESVSDDTVLDEHINDDLDIPRAVQPDGNDNPIQLNDGTQIKKNKALSVALALIALFVFVMFTSSFADKLILSHTNLRPIFAVINQDPYGEVGQIVFDQVNVVYDEEFSAYRIEGQLINLERLPIILPKAEIALKNKTQDIIDTRVTRLTADKVIYGESSIAFSALFPVDMDVKQDVRAVTLRLVDDSGVEEGNKESHHSVNDVADHAADMNDEHHDSHKEEEQHDEHHH
ncbi:MAG: zinc-ribbon domain-containing protein [Pseudomonadota bacterium]|nr:zinc-ribbon domain-containing protein [Pseudomonadota bacterium]MEE3322706.1 zinc-ribbon domain-containing protein [Pseudomonadota bacterium]